jgi:predicted dehydrogenase
MNRRRFLKRIAQGAAATALLYRCTALSAERILGANERINIALIGCGLRGPAVARLMAAVPNVSYVAVCDVSDETISAAKAVDFVARDVQGYKDFRRILDRQDIHAIHVSTPDHWHAIPTILGCQAGKDVYVEKPLAHNVREGRLMIEAARQYKRIVQCGMQHRSAPHYREIEEIIQGGQLGDVHFVRVWNYGGASPQRGYPDGDPPAGVDWDMYLGPAPKVPFNRQRFQRTFRRFYDYAGGYITDFGAHRLDSVHQVMHDDRPLTAHAVGGLYVRHGIEDTPDVIQVTYQYKNWTLSYEGIQLNNFGTGPRIPGGRVPYNAKGALDRPHGEAFYGTKGTIFSDRVGYELFPADGGEPRSVRGADRTDLHVANFIECMRSRKPPVADVEIGHKSSNVCHLGNISYRIGGRKIAWDPDREQIVGDAEASALLAREARKPWDLI